MSNRLNENEIQKMFEAWQEKQTVQSVAIKCKVSPTTVRRYRRLFSWDERLNQIRRRAQQIVDEDAARRKARHIKMMQVIEKESLDVLQVPKERKDKDVMKAGDAARNLIAAVQEERKICGDVDAQDQGEVNNNFEIKVVLVGNP